MRIEIEGVFTSGYYNDMEAGYPVFINGEPLDDLVKNKLDEMGLDSNFCYIDEKDQPTNPLIGKKVRLTLQIEADDGRMT
jgi:hypothetical protein